MIVWLKHDSVDSSRLVPHVLKVSSVPSTSFSKKPTGSQTIGWMVSKVDSYLFGITNMHLNHLYIPQFLHCHQNQNTIHFPFDHIVDIPIHNLTRHNSVIQVSLWIFESNLLVGMINVRNSKARIDFAILKNYVENYSRW